MADVRAKFRCISVTTFGGSSTQRNYIFTAVGASEIPEDQSFAKYTPIGRLEITVDNPHVAFEPTKDYYLDFTQVSEA